MSRFENRKYLLKAYFGRNKMVLNDPRIAIEKNKVNLHYWVLNPYKGTQNLGDYLSPVITEYLKSRYNIRKDHRKGTRHLYGIGSILGIGFQNATVWGSGFMNDPRGSRLGRILHRRGFRKLSIRAVRGPLTREALQALGHKCPEVYGDPAVLMPLVYTPKTQRNTQDYVVVNHFLDNTENENCIPILTTDYSGFIDKLYCAQRVISSSLHGIILAEAYGVPAVLFLPEATKDHLTLYKYQDYYYGTGRKEFPVAHTIQEALSVKPCAIPNWKPIRENLIEAFPADLWE